MFTSSQDGETGIHRLGGTDIKSLKELKGKRVGISDFNSLRHWGIQIQLRKAGLDIERDVEFVRCGVSEHLHEEALKAGKVECAPVSVKTANRLKQEGCNVLVLPRDQYPNGFPQRIIAATGRILKERPDLVKNFSQRPDSLLLVRARYAEEFRVSL